ncbi:MAG TPA: potassium channel family protein [Steroidobacteraceae bacterium]|nr:potassium channel family protein [Steroidobacteraceae bacterium]
MTFVHQTIVAVVLVTLTICLQSTGMAVFIHWGRFHFARGMHNLSSLHSTALMIRFTSMMIGLHMTEILLWAAFYRWLCFPSWESSFYFSTTSYSTVGYGDVVLPKVWRNLGPVESVTGVLMCGLSVSLLFAIVTRLVAKHEQLSSANPREPAETAAPQPASRAA